MVEAVTATMETIRVTAVEEDGVEFFQINDTVLEVLPTDIMSFSDNAVYEESFIRSKAVFAFRSKQSRGKIIVTYPISMHPLAHLDDKEFSTQRDGLRVLNQLNKYPFCFIKSARVRGYLSSRAKISSTDFMMFAVDELNIVLDMRVPDVLFAEIHLIYNDHTSQTADFTFYNKDEKGQVYSVINPIDSEVFKKSFNFGFDDMFSNFQDMLEEMYQGGVYGDNGTPLQTFILHAPTVFHNTQQSMAEYEEELTKLRQQGMVKEVKVLAKNGNNSFTANFLTSFNDPTSTDYNLTSDNKKVDNVAEKGLADPEDDAQSVYVYWTAFHDLSFNGNSAVKSVKISIKNKLAQQYIGSKKYPFNQYLGRYPARMDIAMDFITTDIYKDEMTAVISALGQLNNVIDYNNEMFPEIGAYNVLRVSSVITELLGLRSVIPNQTYITASSSNQGVESVNISFIEAEVEEFMDMAKVVQGRYSTSDSDSVYLQTLTVIGYLNQLTDPKFRSLITKLPEQGIAYASNITVSLANLVKSGLKEFYRGIDPASFEKQTKDNTDLQKQYDELKNDKVLQQVRSLKVEQEFTYYRWPGEYNHGFFKSLGDTLFAASPINLLRTASNWAAGDGNPIEQVANSGAVRAINDNMGVEYKPEFFQAASDLLRKRLDTLSAQKKIAEDSKKAKEEGREAEKYTGSVADVSFKEQGAVNQKIGSIYYDLVAISKLEPAVKTMLDNIEKTVKNTDKLEDKDRFALAAEVIKYTGTNITDLNMKELKNPDVQPFFYLLAEPYFTAQRLIALYNSINKEVLDNVSSLIKEAAIEQDGSWSQNSGLWGIFDETGIDKDNTNNLTSWFDEYYILEESDEEVPNALTSYAGVGNYNGDLDLANARPAAGSTEQKARQMMVYNALKAAGFNDFLSKVFTGIVGRENEYSDAMYHVHVDHANNKINLGLISWQGDRGIRLRSFLKQRGLMVDDLNMKKSVEAINAQALFMYWELTDPKSVEKREDIMALTGGSVPNAVEFIEKVFVRPYEGNRRGYPRQKVFNYIKMLEQQLGQNTSTTQAMLNSRATLAGEHLKPNAKLTDEILAKDYQLIKVSVQDGDTLIYDKTGPKHPSLVGKSEIRFQFLDTPETSHRNGNEKDIKNQGNALIEYETVDQPWAKESTNALKAIIKASGGQVWVPKKIPSDYYDRGISTFYTTNTREDITELMMRAGHGGVWQYQQGGGDPWLNSLIAIQNEARKAKRGMWSTAVTPQGIERFKSAIKELNTALTKSKSQEEVDKILSGSELFKRLVKNSTYKYGGTVYKIGETSKGVADKAKNDAERSKDLMTNKGNNTNTDVAYTGNQNVKINSEFGFRPDGPNGDIHYGIDFAVTGQAKALAGGVATVGVFGGYGRTVIIDHGFGLKTLIAHLANFNPALKNGMRVEYGQVLGTIGGSNKLDNGKLVEANTKGAYGIHLHQETIVKTNNNSDFLLPRIHPFSTRSLKLIEQDFNIEGARANFNIKDYMNLQYLNGVNRGAELAKYEKIWKSGQNIINSGDIVGIPITQPKDSKGMPVKSEYKLAKSNVPLRNSVYYEPGQATLQCYNMAYNQTHAMNLSFPVIKIYLVIGSEVEDPYIGGDIKLNYYFELDGIKDFSLVCNNDDSPVDVALFKIANPSFIKTDLYAVAGKYVKRDLTAVNTYDEVSFIGNRVKINPGTKLHIRMGAGNDPNFLRTVFNGVVTEVGLQEGICLDIIAEGYGRELMLDQLNPGKPDSFGATTPYVFAKAMSDSDSIFNFGNRSKAIKAVLTYVDGVGGVDAHDYSDPETKRLTTRYLRNLPSVHVGGNWRQRMFTNIYAAEVERVHNEYSGTLAHTFNVTVNAASKNSAINENWGEYKYLFYGQTPWEAMKEMEFRNPGTLVKPLFYQDRMTMFFGFKEQMYIARDLDPMFMSRCGNKTVSDAAIGSVGEYMQFRERRFDVVTGFHLASSDLNIISNNIRINNSFKTGVKVAFFDTPYDLIDDPEEINEFKMLTDDSLAGWDIRIGSLKMPGIHEKYSAFVYGTSYLKKEAEKMYDGTITLTGNPCIKAGDYVYINDNLRRLEGLLKVRSCEHYLNEKVGYITKITPGLYVEPRNFIFSVLFLRLSFVAKIALATATLSASIASNDEADFNVYKEYLENLSLYSYSEHPKLLTLKGLSNPANSSFIYEGGYLGVGAAALATLGPLSMYWFLGGKTATLGRLGIKAASFTGEVLGTYYGYRAAQALTGANTAVRAGRIAAILEATKVAFSRGYGAAAGTAVWRTTTAIVGSVTRGVWNVTSRSLSMATSLFSGLLATNPIGWIVRIFISLAVSFVQAKVQENELTRQPLMLFPLAYNGKSYVAGLSGYEYDSYFEAKMKIFERNLKEVSKASYLTNVMSNSTLFKSLRGWLSKGYEKDIIEDINRSFQSVRDARIKEAEANKK